MASDLRKFISMIRALFGVEGTAKRTGDAASRSWIGDREITPRRAALREYMAAGVVEVLN